MPPVVHQIYSGIGKGLPTHADGGRTNERRRSPGALSFLCSGSDAPTHEGEPQQTQAQKA